MNKKKQPSSATENRTISDLSFLEEWELQMSWVLDKDLVDDDHGDQVHVLKHHLHAGQASPQPDPRGKWSSRRFPSSLKVDLVKNVAQFRFRHLLEE